LENEPITLSSSNFDNIQELFTKFKSILFQLKICGIDKRKYQLIISILSKLGFEYSTFVSTFHAIKLVIGATWKILPVDYFVEYLTCEKDKIVQMGALKSSKAHTLATNSNKNTKEKKNQIQKRAEIPNLLRRPLTLRGGGIKYV